MTLKSATAIALIALTAAAGCSDPGATRYNPCNPVFNDADHNTDLEVATLVLLDYIPLGDWGIWVTEESPTRIRGYSLYEDSVIYSTPGCAIVSPQYQE